MNETQLVKFVRFILFLTPLAFIVVYSGFFFPYITSKHFLFRTLLLLALPPYVALTLRSREYRPAKTRLILISTLYFIVLLFASLFGENFTLSFWSNYERMGGLLNYIFLGLYLAMLSGMFKQKEDWVKFFKVLVFVSWFVILVSLSDMLSGTQGRLNAIFGNAIYLAIYMVFYVASALFVYLNTKNKTERKIYLLSILPAVVVMLATASRGANLGFWLGVLSGIIFLLFKSDSKKIKKTVALSLASFVLLAGLVFVFKDSSFITSVKSLKRLTHITVSEGSVDSRLTVWGIALDTIKERPFLGWGMEGFNYGFNKYYNPEMFKYEQWFDRAHNQFLDVAIWSGILGLSIYVLIWLILLYVIYVNKELTNKEKAVFIGVLTAYGFQALTVFDNLSSTMFFVIIIAMASSLHGKELIDRQLPKGNADYKHILLVSSLVILVVFYIFIYKPYKANKYLIEGMRNSALAKALYARDATKADLLLQSALNNFKLSYMYAPYDPIEILGQTAVQADAFLLSKDQVLLENYFNWLNKSLNSAVKKDKNNVRLRLYYADTLMNFGFNETALKELNKVLQYTPDRQIVLIRKFDLMLRMDKKEQARQIADIIKTLPASEDWAIKMYDLLDK